MTNEEEEQNRRIQEFLNTEFSWRISAGECNFLISLLAYLVQANPPFVVNQKGERESLNYQSIRSIVLLNEKLNSQLQHYAAEAAVILDESKPVTERVQ
ncbi:MAG: hypothetical protein HY645_11785 [Acidobacteria bacterium]|nr:hypothetical protein [Acidobacteriota bacterium]